MDSINDMHKNDVEKEAQEKRMKGDEDEDEDENYLRF